MQLQQMAGKLGIVTQMDLAQATAYHSPNGYDTRFGWFWAGLWRLDLAGSAGFCIALEPALWSSNYMVCHFGDLIAEP